MGVIATRGINYLSMPVSGRLWTQVFLNGKAYPQAEASVQHLRLPINCSL